MAKKTEPKKEKKNTPKPRVHQELDGFEVSINEFGEIRANMNVEKINEFLDRNVDDKKLTDREEEPPPAKKEKKKRKPSP